MKAIRLIALISLLTAAITAPAQFVPKTKALDSVRCTQLSVEASKAYNEKRYSASAALYLYASSLGNLSSSALYDAACSFALSGDKARALEFIRASITKGFRNSKHLDSDS